MAVTAAGTSGYVLTSNGAAAPTWQAASALAAATTSVNGYLTSTDWNTFNNKVSSGANSSITSLTNLTTALSVAQGGTGAATLTGVLVGNGTGAITASSTLGVANGGTGLASGNTYGIPYYTGPTSMAATSAGSPGDIFTAGFLGLPGYSTSIGISGNIATTAGQIYGVGAAAGTANSIDWNNGNIQSTTFVCNGSSTIALTNLHVGGAYTLTVTGTSTGKCKFSAMLSDGTTNLTTGILMSPTNADPNITVDRPGIYTLIVIGTKVYISWIAGDSWAAQ